MKKILLGLLMSITIIFISFANHSPANTQEVFGRKKANIIETTPIKVIQTDSTRRGLDPNLGFKDKGSISEGTKCYICSGSPKNCYEQPCDTIVIVQTDD